MAKELVLVSHGRFCEEPLKASTDDYSQRMNPSIRLQSPYQKKDQKTLPPVNLKQLSKVWGRLYCICRSLGELFATP